MQGSLEPVPSKYITPKRTKRGQSSPDYSPAYPVDVSPIKDVKKAAIATSMQEAFEKRMMTAKGRRRRHRKTLKRRRTSKRI
jgi:hypothetical protein